jgi:hypothetical protein
VFNYVSGKLVGNPLKGGANSITILRPNTFEGNLAAFHNHTKKGFNAPSGEDFEVCMGNNWLDYFIALSSHEIWVIKAKGYFPNELINELSLKINSGLVSIKFEVKCDEGIPSQEKINVMNNSILSSAVLQVDAVEMGSLILFVSSANNQSSLNNESYLKRGLENLNDIISCGDNEELLLDKMKTMGTQPIFKYKNLLKILKNNKLNLDMYKSVAPKGFEPQCLSSEFAKKVYEVIDDSSKEKSDTIDIMGELYIIDTHRNVCLIVKFK